MSTYQTIIDQLIAALQTTADTLTGTPNVVKRKKFTIEEADPQYLVVVSPAGEQEVGSDEFENTLYIDYGVLIGITTGQGQELDGSFEDLMLTYRETIRLVARSVNVVTPNIHVTNVACNLQPPFSLPAIRDNRDVSSLLVTYTVQEARNL